ncbi:MULTISPECIES: ParB N-terminal domain-containing protein [Pseudoalteromonas]|nr:MULTISPECIES: ParB N-terminal domain-containing protein [Pseudoalteromonas]
MPLDKSIHFMSPQDLKPNEEVIPERVEWLQQKVLHEQIWRVPITVDRLSGSIMDGHHRHLVACRLGLAKVPCILLDYDEVEFISTHPSRALTPKCVIEHAQAGQRLPAKSTRHQFVRPLPNCNISLKLLIDNSYQLDYHALRI